MTTYPDICRVCGGIGWRINRETRMSEDCPACGGTGNEPVHNNDAKEANEARKPETEK